MKNKYTLLIPLILLIKIVCFAQTNDLAFRHLTTENGLSFNYTWCILKDDKGFMWFGTRYGLNRFDGTHIKTYYGNSNDSSSLYNSEVFSLQMDRFGTIWILTGGGLCYLNTNEGYIIHRMNAQRGSVNQVDGNKLYIDHSQHLWTFTGEAFCEYNIIDTGKLKMLRCVKALYPNDTYVNFFEEDNKGNIYCSTDAGFYKIMKGQKNITEIKVPARMNGVTLASDLLMHQGVIVRYALWDNDTTVWLGMYNGTGLVTYNPNTGNFVSYKYKQTAGDRSNMIRKLFPGKNKDDLWVGTYDDGLYLFNTKTKNFAAHYTQSNYLPQGLTSNNVRDVLVDDYGILWLATGSGVSYGNLHQLMLHDVKVPFATGNEDDDVINNIVEDTHYQLNHTLWIASSGSGLIKFNDSNFQYQRINAFSSIGSVCIDKTNANYLWVAAQKGLKHIDTRSLHIVDVDIGLDSMEKIYGLAQVNSYTDKLISVTGFGYGMYMYNSEPYTIKVIFKTDTSLHSFNPTVAAARDTKGRIYIYTTIGQPILNRTDPLTNITEHIISPGRNEYGLPDLPFVNVFSVAENSLLLIYPNSVYRLNLITKKKEKIILPLLKKGENWYVSSMDASGIIWLLSPNLMAGINANGKLLYEQEISIINTFYSNITYGNNGNMYIAQTGHYLYFNPAQFKSVKPILPEVKITSLNILEKEQPLIYENHQIKNYNLNYHQNIIRFEFAALNYATPSSNHYEYKLEGFNKGWIDCGTRTSATFTNLDGGDYTFMVKAANGNNSFGSSIAALSFYVSPPFYDTWWFFSLCILAIYGFANFVLYTRHQHVLQLFNIRNRIAQDLHDDVGSALSSISIFSDVINKNLKTSNEKTSALAARIGDNARQVIESMSDIIWAIKPSNESVAEMLIRMKQLCSNLFESKEIAFQFEADEKVASIKLPMNYRRDIYLIFKEAVNNILKYADCKNVMIKFIAKDSMLELFIQDDGKGFNVSSANGGNGLQNMKTRAGAMHGNVSIESELQKGTIVHFVVPIS